MEKEYRLTHLLILLAYLVSTVQADESPMSQLRQDMFFGYDRNVIPQPKNASGTYPLQVLLGVAPKWMDMESNGVLTIICWLRLVWNDPRLAWDPSKHHNISTFRITPDELWKPDIALYNKKDLDHGILAADPRSSNINAHVQSNGNVLWIPPVSHKVLCEGVTYDNWPWGKQYCNLDFGSWTFDASQYDLNFYENKPELDLRNFGNYNQFKIMSQQGERKVTRYDCCPEQYVSLNFKFSLRREYVVDPNLGRIDNPDWEGGEH
ncbi:neuronal acetylcholine receptor subunit alpha-2 [Eurytemora carolleeae]|uniref:neuronal acetylcholine receptor subunit alpha-2 n=1 Tax=Eurytemora carolleeae TaxID=1294199 RepID=UPI000C779C8D|nr:neuronal acetylcholine receptor subunit alpha-2 [Eurytemora carolleeae]|eukprot:XP_023321465.1 neuronal acetylcholine receptor subunit alpha-2-like [Eurytemora affinis]